MTTESRVEFLQNPVVRLVITDSLDDARALLRRFQEVDSFNAYVHERMPVILIAMLIMLLISLGCVMGIVSLLPDMHWVFVLPLLMLLPLVLAGSLFVQIYVFFSWIEGRSMERALASRHKAPRGKIAAWLQSKLKLNLGPIPSVPWIPAALLFLAPLLMLASSWRSAAITFVVLGILVPIAYAILDR